MVSPSVLIVLALVVAPIAWTIMLAFQDIQLIRIRYTGLLGNYTLDNFTEVFATGACGAAWEPLSPTRSSAPAARSCSVSSQRSR